MFLKNLCLSLVIALTGVWGAFASETSVRIIVKDTERLPLIGATVQLTAVEEELKAFRIADQMGVAVFEALSRGAYHLKISYVGFESLEELIAIGEGSEVLEFELLPDALLLGEVTVTARRPLIRQEGDKMVIDPEPMAHISTNTLEILESTPGLFVDQDGGIFLSSATPATILINGREQRMSNQDINTILRSLPPGSVQRIEVIRSPSARYAASSSGGIVNIVLKRGVRIGRFGSLNTGMNQGVYGNRFAGFSLNNGGNVVTSYLNANYNYNDRLDELSSNRVLRADTLLYQSADTRRTSHQASAGYGLSYEAYGNWNFNYDGRINGSLPSSSSLNVNQIRTGDNERLSETDNKVDGESGFLSIRQDLGMVHKLDTTGSQWDTRLGYGFNRNNAFQQYRSGFIFPFAGELQGEGDNNQRSHFLQLESDLTYGLPLQITLEAGLSSSLLDYESNSDYYLGQSGELFPDSLRTNAFAYNERINALYMQLSRNLGANINIKGGLRFEHTFMQGNQTVPADTSFLVNRSDWFPYVYLSRPLFEMAGFELRSFLIYRRTITRPGYQNLNPYISYVDQFLYETGNPSLTPQFADNFEANISFDDMPVFAVGRSYTRDIFSAVVYQDPQRPEIAMRTYDNLGRNKETYFRAIAGIPPGGRYFFALGAQYNLNEYEGMYENQPLEFTSGSWRFFTFHMLRLAKDTRLTVSGFMMTGGQMNFYELETFGQLNIGLNQTFLDRKLTITLNARDVLRTMVNDFSINQGSVSSTGRRYTDNQRIGINIRYNFGIPDRQQRNGRNMLDFDGTE